MKTKQYVYLLFALIMVAMMLMVVPSCKDEAKLVAIALNKSEISLVQGTSETLKAEVVPTGLSASGIEWSSENISIATVDNNGKVTAVGPGETDITAQKGGFIKSCRVMVTGTSVAVQGVAINKLALEMNIGAEQQLILGFTPDNATNREVLWKSSDETVATVSASGVVNALKPGTAVITVRTKEGNFTANTNVTVVGIPVESISMAKTALSLGVGRKEKLIATVIPIEATVKMIWTSSNDAVATISEDGTVTAVSIGTAVIKATAVTDKTKFSECTVTVIPPYVPEMLKPTAGTNMTVTGLNETEFSFTTSSEDAIFTFSPFTKNLPASATKLRFKYKSAAAVTIVSWGWGIRLGFSGSPNSEAGVGVGVNASDAFASSHILEAQAWTDFEIDLAAARAKKPEWGITGDHLQIKFATNFVGVAMQIKDMEIVEY